MYMYGNYIMAAELLTDPAEGWTGCGNFLKLDSDEVYHIS